MSKSAKSWCKDVLGSVKTITVGVYGRAEQHCANRWREDLICGNANLRLRAERKEPWSGVNSVFNTRTSQDSVPNCLSVDILAPDSFVPSSRPVEFKLWK